MRVFIKKLIFFVVGFLILFYLIALYYDLRLMKSSISRQKLDFFNKNTNAIKVLFIGDSHSDWAIKNRFLPDNFYNFSFSAANTKLMYLSLKYALKKHSTIDYIVLPLDYHSLNNGFADNSYYDVINLFEPENKDIELFYNKPLIKVKLQLFLYKYFMFFEKRQIRIVECLFKDLILSLLGRTREVSMKLDEFGDFPNDSIWTDLDNSKRKMIAVESAKGHSLNAIVNEDLVDYLEMIISLCRSNNIKVIGIQYPISLEYQEVINGYDVSALHNIYDNLNIYEKLDYINVFDDKQECFADADHLNNAGGEIFTKLVIKKIKKLIFNSKIIK